MDKKNIDELFREKFKAFRVVPDEKVWTDIENSLDKKRKKRVLPFWWPLGGVAALLAIGFFAFYTMKDSADEPSTITNSEEINSKDTKQDATIKQNQKDALQIPETTEDAVANSASDENLKNTEGYDKEEAEGVSGSKNTIGTRENKNRKNVLQIQEVNKDGIANSGKDIQNENTEKPTESKVNTGTFPDKLLDTDVARLDDTSQKDNIKMDSGNKKDSGNLSPEKTQMATNVPESNRTNPNVNRKTESGTTIPNTDEINVTREGHKISDVVADSDASRNSNTSKAVDKKKAQDGIATTQKNLNVVPEASDTAIAQNNQMEKDDQINDTIVKDNKKSIFEALEAQNEEEEIAEESGSRWSAGPNVAPVYFNAMGEGSPIDPDFTPNAKSGSTNMSYGLSIAYAVTKKLSVRSGIHKADYGYETNDVGFSPTLAASTSGRLQNIDYAGGAENLALNSSVSDAASPESFSPEVNSLNATRDGNVSQQFGYLEVPLELDYALLDNRFGVNLVGGISSLFLTNNSITLSSDELTTQIGEARNLNDINFSANIGFGVNYKFTPKIQLNIEPVFKYQLNTFSNVSGDFRPFSIGVYSGLNFKF